MSGTALIRPDYAELLEWPEVGALEPGRFADVIAVRRDPLDDVDALTEVDFVMKGGRVVVQETEDPARR